MVGLWLPRPLKSYNGGFGTEMVALRAETRFSGRKFISISGLRRPDPRSTPSAVGQIQTEVFTL